MVRPGTGGCDPRPTPARAAETDTRTSSPFDHDIMNDIGRLVPPVGAVAEMAVQFSQFEHFHHMVHIIGAGKQIGDGDQRIIVVMVESHLEEGRQDLVPGEPLVYGRSITDACLGWEDSVALLEGLAQQVRRRRALD